MFEVGQEYSNRRGRYTVLALNPPRMTVRFEDGSVVDLNIAIQERIWQNIVDDNEAARRKIARREARSLTDARLYVRSIVVADADDRSPGALREQLSMMPAGAPVVQSGDRFIYYAIEPRVFFAVATVTGSPVETKRKAAAKKVGGEVVYIVPLDWDTQARNLEGAISLDAVELESEPNFRALLQKPENYLAISEDDFELVAELLTELTEDELDDDEGEDIEEEEEL